MAITVFDGVVMQIIGVTIKIGFVTDLMFPKTALPERGFPMFAFGRVQFIRGASFAIVHSTDALSTLALNFLANCL